MVTHLTHWGAFEAESNGERLTALRPHRDDPEPSPLLHNLPAAQHHPTRVDRPYVRAGWLEHGPGPGNRGDEPFVPVDWDTALDLVAGELRRVYQTHGPRGVFGGSYGWSSAGRFHHAQSQLHRFLNYAGGYVRSVHSYSHGVSSVLLPYVLADAGQVILGGPSWDSIVDHTDLVVAFGGMPTKNTANAPGGVSRHTHASTMARARKGGTRFVLVSPLRDDVDAGMDARWLPLRPGTDAALMLGLAHVLEVEDLADTAFLATHTTGYPRFRDYLLGESDGVVKTPEWAEAITGIPAGSQRELARRMAACRTLVTVSWSLQRTRHGEQPVWLGVVLAAMLGQIGLPGGGFGHGYASAASTGRPRVTVPRPTLRQGVNSIDEFIPVSRIADMLLHPGGRYDFDGRRRHYPHIRLVYWSGGNPFHHHQDLARLRRAFGRIDTLIVHEPFWTATARHADVVLPATMTIERDDLGIGLGDARLFTMPALTRPHGQARDDYAIFADLAQRLGMVAEFTEGRDVAGWLRHIYQQWREVLCRGGVRVPDFDVFWRRGFVDLPVEERYRVPFADFRADPRSFPLSTPSGKIEIFSATIDGYGYDDCPGHPVWLEPDEWLGGARGASFPLHLIANQPRSRLHSQLDVGEHSQSTKVAGREPLRMNPRDAAARGIAEGNVARVFNDRGACLAGVVCDENVRRGVVQLSTGAWYDPDPADPRLCRHGNPNVLTADVPSSKLAQGCTGQHVLVEVERYDGEPPPPLSCTGPPVITNER